MLAKLHQKVLAASLTLLFSTATTVSLAADVKPALDMGATNNAQKVNVTLVLKLHNQDQLEDYVQQTVTPGSAHYRQFLTTSQFASQYGATDAEIAQVQSFLQKQGLAAGAVLPNHMAIQTSGTLAQFSAAFQAPIHTFVSRENGRSFHRPTQPLVLPSGLANVLLHATGPNNEHQLLSHRISAPSDVRRPTCAGRLRCRHSPRPPPPPRRQRRAAAIPPRPACRAATPWVTWRTSTTSIRCTRAA